MTERSAKQIGFVIRKTPNAHDALNPTLMENIIEGSFWKIAIVVMLAGAALLAHRHPALLERLFEVLGQKIARILGRASASLEERRFAARESAKAMTETLDSATIAIGLVFFVIQPFILQSFWIPTGSMENTLRVNDRLLVSRAIYRFEEPKFQDVIVFEPPAAAAQPPHTDFIKRCMGTPGDVIEMRKGVLFRNGTAVPEIYQLWNSGALPYDMKIVGGAVYSRNYDAPNLPGEWTRNQIPAANQTAISAAKSGAVPVGNLLMLGDHRSHSLDGHFWGFAPRKNVIGKAVCVFWPPKRLGLVDNLTRYPRP